MKMTSVTLKNFRCFKNLTIDLDEKLTVLVALNGQGKTSVLDAIRIAVWPYISAFDVVAGTMPNSGIEIDDVRLVRNKNTKNMEPQLPSRIEAQMHYGNQPLSLARERDKVTKRSKTSVREAKALSGLGAHLQTAIRVDAQDETELTHNLNTALPMVSYYGTGRLWRQRYLTLKNQAASDFFSRTYAYVGCLDTGSDYKYFAEWFFYLFAADFEQKTQRLEKSGYAGLHDVSFMYADLMQAIRDAVDHVVEPQGWRNLSYSPAQATLVMQHANLGELKVDQLSDGLKSVIAMTADIAYRCVRLNPHWGVDAAKNTSGIVIVDEIDMHLHPEWQQTILESLQRAFPNIQFIVTTHSPQVLSTVNAKSIRLISNTFDYELNELSVEAVTPATQSRGVSSSDVMATLQGTDPIPPVAESAWLRRYKELISQSQHLGAEGEELRAKIQLHFGMQHAEWLDCERLIRLQAMKEKIRQLKVKD